MESLTFLWQLAVLIGLGLVIHPATRLLAVDRRRPTVERPRSESRVAVFTVLFVMLLGVFAFETIAPFQAAPGAPAPELDGGQALRLLAAYAVTSLPVWLVLAARSTPLATAGIGRQNLFRALLLGLATGAAFAVITIALDPASAAALTKPALWLALAAFLGVGLIEEVIYRGYFQSRLSWAVGPVPALAIAAVVMALSPLPHYLASQQLAPGEALRAVGVMLAPSLLLGWFMTRVQNVAGPAVLHGFIRWSFLIALT